MFKTILAWAWIIVTMSVLFLGLNGSIDRAAMVIFSLAALTMFFAFALFTVFVNTPASKAGSIN